MRRRVSRKEREDDEDVAAERTYAHSSEGLNEAVCVRNLRKVYGRTGHEKTRKVAVDNLDLVVPKRQCFGLLGENGAGKSTTMKMLSGDILKTSGEAYVESLNVTTQKARVRQLIGYCPQFDPLLPRLTGRETLEMYARLKGMDENKIEDVVSGALETLGLDGHGDKQCGGYSGGMKRKLSLGIALIGDPSVVFLDEPSSGMDPVSRRLMWDVIQAAALERSIVLTSHYMEECEALCSKIAILVQGKLACVGPIQRLKARFGKGYHLFVRVAESSSGRRSSTMSSLKAAVVSEGSRGGRVESLIAMLCETFRGAHVVDRQGLSAKLWIPLTSGDVRSSVSGDRDRTIRLSKIFETMESVRKKYGVEDYGINQPTLEQVFLEIATRFGDKDSRGEEELARRGVAVDLDAVALHHDSPDEDEVFLV